MDSNTKTILVRGTWLESYNVGDNAIIEGLKSALKGRGELKALTGDVARVRRWLEIDAVKIINARNPLLFLRIFREVRSARAFLLTGGTPLYNDVIQMFINYLISLICRLFGVPVFVFGVSYRECPSKLVRLVVAGIFRNCEKIYFREYGSIERVKDVYGDVVIAKVGFLPDPATQIDSGALAPPAIADIANNIPIPEQPYVVLCPRDFSAKKSFSNHHYDLDFDVDKYLSQLSFCLKQLLETTEYQIVFLPMNVEAPDDDGVVASYLFSLYEESYRERMTVIDAQLHPVSVAKIFRDASFSITVRFHAGVLSCSNGTPMISLAYDKKNIDIAEVLEMVDSTYDLKTVSENDLANAISYTDINLAMLSDRCVENNLLLRDVFRDVIHQHFPMRGA
jgi:polysaccharide pyruvyl transferase WcaK-like protein